MTDLQLYKEIESLPEELKKQVLDFIDLLKQKTKGRTKTENFDQATPKFGCLKGKIEMTADFDEPLEDFKEYM